MKKQIALILLLTMLCTLLCPAAFAGTQEDPNGNAAEVSEETPAESDETPAVFGVSKEDFLARCQELSELAEKGKKKQVLALYDTLREQLNEMADQISRTQAQGGEVSAATQDAYSTCRSAFCNVGHALTQGNLREKLKDHISDEEFSYLEQYTPVTEEQLAKMRAAHSSSEQYQLTLSDAMKKASANLNGKTYTYEQLQEPSPEGLTEEERSKLLEQCRSQISDSCADAFIQVITARRELAKEMGVTSLEQLRYAENDRKVFQEDLQTFYQAVKEYASDPRFSGNFIRGESQDITTEEFLDEFTAIVEEASPLAAEALEYLKDTGSLVLNKDESELSGGEITYLYSDYQPGLLKLSLGKTNDNFVMFGSLLGAYTGVYASDGTRSLLDEDRKNWGKICGNCLTALFTAYYDSVLSDTDAAIQANNTVTNLKNQLISNSMKCEWEQYLYSDAPLTKEGLNEKYNSLREAYGIEDAGWDKLLDIWFTQGLDPDALPMRISALSAFYALQVFNKAMEDPDDATEMFEDLCENLNDEDFEEVLTDAGFVYFTDEDGVRETLEKAAENYHALHEYASEVSEAAPVEPEKTPIEAQEAPVESEEAPAESEKIPTESKETPAVSEETTTTFAISKEDFLARCQELSELAEKGKKKQVLALYDTLREQLSEMADQISRTQAQGGEVSAATQDAYSTCRSAFCNVGHALTQGELREKLEDHISEEEFAYLERFTALTAEQSEQREKEISLREKYLTTLSNAAKKASATLNGKTYTYKQLQKDTPEGLTEEERIKLLEQCRSQIIDSCADAFIQVITARRELAKEMGVTSFEQLRYAENDCKVSQEDLQTFYQTVKEYASDPRFSGTTIPGESQDITTEEFLDEFTAIVEEASPLAAEALEYLKDTGSLVLNKAESDHGSGEITYLYSDYQPGLLTLSLGEGNGNDLLFASLLGAYTGVYASDGTSCLQEDDRKYWGELCGACLTALFTAYYDSVLSDTDAAIQANNTVTFIINHLISYSMMCEWEQYLYSDAPLTKEGLIEKYNSLSEAYGEKEGGSRYNIFDTWFTQGFDLDALPKRVSVLSAFYALQVFNKAMKDPDKATEMFEDLCENLNDEDALKDTDFVYFADEDGVRKTLEKAAENYQVLNKQASDCGVASDSATTGTPSPAPTPSEPAVQKEGIPSSPAPVE